MRLTALAGSLLLLALWTPVGSAATTVYVSAAEAQLRQERGLSGKVVANVQRGEPLQVTQQDERWYYVTTQQGAQGWIYRYKVTTTPSQNSDNLAALLGGSSSRVKIAESSSASGIRGLNPTAEKQARRRGNQPRAIQAVQQMEAFHINAQDLQQFLRSGKLGEYYEGN